MCLTVATPGLELMELGPEEPVVLFPADHVLAAHPFLTLAKVEALPGYAAQLRRAAGHHGRPRRAGAARGRRRRKRRGSPRRIRTRRACP
ncbi:hypothetical protein [Streptomyces sp. NPDC001652]|uniref:hypothetical protein n=1 Tax=Streptomyces sp. NPDC001652 TaxID=3154393 RepID=UPI0033282C61